MKEQAEKDLISVINNLPLVKKDYDHLIGCIKILTDPCDKCKNNHMAGDKLTEKNPVLK